ncbi:hypothetical protein B0H19DRAFT_10238 [Mycena capillaripes]|nr:hypothetical protein B0H19DRAFT_10238 [Mycena capillaripes]
MDLTTIIDGAFLQVEHAAAAARASATQYNRTIADLQRAVGTLREQNEELEIDLAAALKRERTNKRKVKDLEEQLAEERARAREAEKALKKEREGIDVDLAEATESIEDSERRRRRSVRFGAYATPSRAIDRPNDTSRRPSRASKCQRLSTPTSSDPEQPQSLADLERDIIELSQPLPRNWSHAKDRAEAIRIQELSKALLRHAENL